MTALHKFERKWDIQQPKKMEVTNGLNGDKGIRGRRSLRETSHHRTPQALELQHGSNKINKDINIYISGTKTGSGREE